ncbi:MAG: glycosyltransferase [Acidimicrobiales bacterium]
MSDEGARRAGRDSRTGGARQAELAQYPDRIDQIVPSFAAHDAIGAHVRHMRDAIRRLGVESDVWAIDSLPEVRREARQLDTLPGGAIPGTPAAEVFAGRSEVKILDYHNLTPGHMLASWAPQVQAEVDLGRKQLDKLAPECFFALADSAYNEAELHEAGCHRTRVLPPLFDLGILDRATDADLARRLAAERQTGGSDWLFVGKVAPHKAQHELVKALAVYRRIFDPDARLHLVGTGMGEDYPRALERFARRLGVADALRMAGVVPPETLATYYRAADVFVSASEHEGFGVPLVEAMHAGTPVVARAFAAVPETVGTGGLLLDDPSPIALAVAVHRVVTDAVLRDALAGAGRRRAAFFSLERGVERVEQFVAEVAALLAADGSRGRRG